jgi:curved DNA-binding protein CbpA
MRDPYAVLGVPRSATAENIKTRYRRLAKALHPDGNKNDPKAAAHFSELNAAYEILGDEDNV